MKNTIFFAALVLALIAVFAAPARADGLILRGGMNFANAKTDPEIDEDNQRFRLGGNAALLGELGDGGVRLLVGGGYEQRGLKVTSGSNEGKMSLDYITVPVMISVGTSSTAEFVPRLFVNLGVEPAFLVSSKVAFGAFTSDFDAEEFDFGLRGEVGMELPVSASAGLYLGGGYSQSLTDAIKGDDLESKSYNFHLFAGVKIGMF